MRSIARVLVWVTLLVALAVLTRPVDALDFGTGPVLLLADRVRVDTKRHLVIAEGNVEVARGERRLHADRLSYDQDADRIDAEGNVVLFEPSGEVFFAESVNLSGDLKDGVAEQLRARTPEDELFAATRGRRVGGTRTELERAVYSPCPLCAGSSEPPLWQITAREVTHDQETHEIVYHHAFLEMAGVPVLYTPYFSHPDPTVERKSGFLVPTFGNNSDLGLSLQTPYYFALAPNYDLTVAPIVYTRETPVLTAEYRHLLPIGPFNLAGSGTYAEKLGSSDTDSRDEQFRGHLRGQGRFRLPNKWQSGYDLYLASDDTYLQRYGFSNQNVLTNDVFGERYWERSFASISGFGFQGLREQDDQDLIPIVLPWGQLHLTSEPWRWNSRFTLDSSALATTRTGGLDTRRLSTTGGWRLPWLGPIGDRYELRLDLRGDVYQTDGDPATFEDNGSNVTGRVVPRATLQWSLPLVNDRLPFTPLIEPTITATWAPSGLNSNQIPNEDSQDVEFDDTSLFDPNRFPGLDRVEEGASLNYGLRFAAFGDEGQMINGLFGQTLRLDEQKDLTPATGLSGHFSDYVGRVDFTPTSWLRVGYRFRIDSGRLDFLRNEMRARVGPRRLRFDVNYLFLEDDPAAEEVGRREEITAGVTIGLTDRLSVRTAFRRNLEEDSAISKKFGLVYTHPCLQLIAGIEQDDTDNRDAGNQTTFSIRVAFQNLGELHADSDMFGPLTGQ